jgi:hypothetical protein
MLAPRTIAEVEEAFSYQKETPGTRPKGDIRKLVFFKEEKRLRLN